MTKRCVDSIKSYYNKAKNTKLLFNFLNLAAIYGLELLIPLLTLPYVIKVCGIELYGLVAFATALFSYFGVLINYGFNLTGTKEVAQNIENKVKVSEIFFSVNNAKLFLSVVSLLALLIMFIFVTQLQDSREIFLIVFGTVLAQNFSPIWFFQGIQKLSGISKVNIGFRLLGLIGIYLIVKQPTDGLYVVLIPFVCTICSTIISLILVRKYINLSCYKFSIRAVFDELVKGKYVFLSQVKITFFNSFNILVLGFMTSDAIVGFFSAADKVIKAMSAVQIPVVTALYPYFSTTVKKDIHDSFKNITRIALYGGACYFLGIVGVFIFSDYISELLFEKDSQQISLLIKVMCFIPLFVFLNNMFGTQFLLNLGQDKRFLANLISAAIINVVLIFPLVNFYGVIGAAFSVLITEFFVFASMYLAARIYIKDFKQ